ncbi:Di-copper centre-containing protein [Basidiobolus meristosporus CBS 931.73]|uniref:Di-copper centre-containing protein n=1 Tax=Basidiobolus meristosporus CBS 931.73 TaxID=1314790 RepID=A0A1Y1Z3P8_9FUNG|nr:Di-copper centre-containing protein [Basidiobolus meristosporus CBS 931.73]|eukprot:ORY04901.1 Di-copper centre-containing protein [Basidiobolus meristosporus CBS 931.73]
MLYIRLLELVLFVALYTFPVLVGGQGCAAVSVRREIRQLSQNERREFFDALKTLHNPNGSSSAYDELTLIHANYANEAHSGSAFCPWHRQYLRVLETKLQQINPKIMLPYWDWTIDSQAPHQSEIFNENYFGGDGDLKGCVSNGPFAGWQMKYPDPHCLSRKFNLQGKIGTFYSSDVIMNVANSSRTYADFRGQLESPIHGVVHMGIGGDMTAMTSPNDPLFWLHHAFIDKIWADWQATSPQRASEYNGKRSNGTDALPTDSMSPFDVSVSDVLDTTATGLCYRYSNSMSANRKSRRAKSAINPTTLLNGGEEDKLHIPEKLDAQWIQQNGGVLEDIRSREQQLEGIIQRLNGLKDYVSPNARSRREESLVRLLHGTLGSLFAAISTSGALAT